MFATRWRISLRLARALQFVFVLAGLAVLVWAFSELQFRDASGFPRGTICLPIAVGIAFLFMAWAFGNSWRQFSFWFSLGLVGQAVSLQLIDAGTTIHYQHYVSMGTLLAEHLWLALFVLVQTILVGLAITRRFASIRIWTNRVFHPWQLFVIAVVFAVSSVALSRDISEYVSEVIWATFLQLVSLGNLVIMVWAMPAGAVASLQQQMGGWFEQTKALDGDANYSLDRFALLSALFVTVLTALLATFSYAQHPHIADEVAYLLHARFLAAGSLTLPAPAVPQAFEIYLMQFKGDQWFAATPPGWPAVLALGVRLGVPWLVNPFLAGVNVLLAYLLIQEVYDRKTARWVILFLCVSPWFLFMSMNFMTHTLTMTCALAAGVLVAWAKRQERLLWGLLAGGFAGAGSLIRPLDGLIVAVLLALWLWGAKSMHLRFRLLIAFALGAIVVGSFVLPYNLALTGKATVFPLNAYLDEQFGPGKNDLGFGENRGYGWALQPFPGHTPLGALVNTALNIFSLNTELFGWSIGSLLFLTLFLVSGKMGRRDFLMLAVIVFTIVFFAFYWYSGGPDFGARYWYIVLIPCVVLTIRGIQVLQSKLALPADQAGNPMPYVMIGILMLSLMSLVNYVPWRALDKYHNYLSMRPDIATLSKTYGFQNSLVLIRGEAFPDYSSAAIYNPLDWNTFQTIYAWDKDTAVRDALMRAYPDRAVWIVQGPSRSYGGYQVIAGPLTPAAVLEQ